MMSFKQYLGIGAGLALLLMASVCGFIGLVDPYRIFGAADISGFNVTKPQAYNQAQWAKSALLARQSPATVILGNSRLDVGLDPNSALWPENLRPVFNQAIPGMGIQGVARTAPATLKKSSVRTVVVGLDFLDFLTDTPYPNDKALTFSPAHHGLKDYATVLASQTAAVDAVKTLLAQGDADAATMTAQGFNPLRNYNRLVASEGHYALAYQRNVENYRTYVKKPKTTLPDPDQSTPDYAALAALLAAVEARDLDAHFIIYPYHADVLEGFERAGLRPAFDQWKQRVATMIENAEISADADGDDTDMTLWDFSGYTAITTERFPPKGDTRTILQWYWEPGHFKASVGDAMLKEMFASPAARLNFGTPLTPQNLPAVLAAYDSGQRQYRREAPAEIARVDRLFSQIGRH